MEQERENGPEDERDPLHDAVAVLETTGGKAITVSVWATNRADSRGQTVLGYELHHGEELIFRGEDFAGSPLHADDSDQTLAALLGFLSLKPGDTDGEYFDDYTPAQREWCDTYGEELGLVAHQLSEAEIHCLEDLLRSQEFDRSRFGSSSDDFLHDPERAQRVRRAAEHGASGSTHAEVIEDWRVCLREEFKEIPELIRVRIAEEIDEIEKWHHEHGSLDQEIG